MSISSAHRDPPKGEPRTYPDLLWHLDVGGRHMPPGGWLPMLVEFDPIALRDRNLPGKRAIEWFTSKLWLPDNLQSSIFVPPLFLRLPRILLDIDDERDELRYCVICAHHKAVEGLLREPAWQAVVVQVQVGPAIENPSEQLETSSSLLSDDPGGRALSDGGTATGG